MVHGEGDDYTTSLFDSTNTLQSSVLHFDHRLDLSCAHCCSAVLTVVALPSPVLSFALSQGSSRLSIFSINQSLGTLIFVVKLQSVGFEAQSGLVLKEPFALLRYFVGYGVFFLYQLFVLKIVYVFSLVFYYFVFVQEGHIQIALTH